MKKCISLLSLAIICACGSATAAPSIKILSPKTSPTTNGTLNAFGTVKSSTGVSAIYYSLNGADFAPVDAFTATTWGVSNLALTAGTDLFLAYAVDTNGVSSPTGKVSFVYVVKVPIAVSTNGNGKVSPNYDGQSLQIGKKYHMKAQASKGWGFVNWDGSTNSTNASLTFIMASNLTFTATFVDIQKPVCVVTFPAVKHSVSNSPLTVTGKASDNVGVASVYQRLNDADFSPAVLDADGTNWSAPGLIPNVGSNFFQAFAMDAAGNSSMTNAVVFSYFPGPVTGPAPASLSGMVGNVQIEGTEPFEISFDDASAAVFRTDSDGPRFGAYTYTLLSSNTAQLNTIWIAPPNAAGTSSPPLFTFTNNTTAVFTDSDGSNGVIVLTNTANIVPSPSSFMTIQAVDSGGNTNVTIMGGGTFTNFDGTGTQSDSGTYIFERFSPIDAMVQFNYTDGPDAGSTNYAAVTFASTTSGSFFDTIFDSIGDVFTVGGDFSILSISNPPAGPAPLNIAGMRGIAHVTHNGVTSTVNLAFGDTTMSQQATSTNNDTAVANYTFMKTGPNTALLTWYKTAPPVEDPVTFVPLTFSTPTSASFSSTNESGHVTSGSVSIGSMVQLGPDSVAGRTLNGSGGGHTDQVIFGTNGTFTHHGSNGIDNTGTYTATRYSPSTIMVVIHITSGSDTGNTSYAQLTFTSPTGGSTFITSFDPLGNQQDSHGGTFSIQ